jgi:hypothetical protein
MALLLVLMDFSTANFQICNLLNQRFGVQRSNLMFTLAAIGVIIFFNALFLWPSQAFVPVNSEILTKEEIQESEEYCPNYEESFRRMPLPRGPDSYIAKYSVLNLSHLSLWQAVAHPVFFLGAVNFMFTMFNLNFYVGTVEQQLTSGFNLSNDTTAWWTSVFAWTLPCSQLMFIPIVGWVLDTQHRWVTVLILCILHLSFAVASMLPNLDLQVATFVLNSVTTGYSLSTMSSYFMEIFGSANFGRLWGVCFFMLGGLTFLAIPLNHLVSGPLHGDFFDVNLGFVVVTAVTFLVPNWLRNRQMVSTRYRASNPLVTPLMK